MRRTTPAIALAACLTLLASGCDVAGTLDVLPGLKGSSLSNQQQVIADQLVTDLVANVQASTDLDLGTLFTEATGATAYRVQRAGVNKEALKQAQTKLKERLKPQLDKHKAGMKTTSVATASVTVEGVVCVATTTKVEFARGGVTQSQTVTRTVDPDGDLLKVVADLSRSFKNGMAFTARRERTNAADGSYTAIFHSESAMKGKTRTVDWTRQGLADGSETGTGTIKRFNGTTVTLTVTRTADGVTVIKTSDDAAKVGVEVAQTEGSTAATAKVTDVAKGTETVATIPDTEATQPAAE